MFLRNVDWPSQKIEFFTWKSSLKCTTLPTKPLITLAFSTGFLSYREQFCLRVYRTEVKHWRNFLSSQAHTHEWNLTRSWHYLHNTRDGFLKLALSASQRQNKTPFHFPEICNKRKFTVTTNYRYQVTKGGKDCSPCTSPLLRVFQSSTLLWHEGEIPNLRERKFIR
jgi:hypothetical protein